MMTSVNQRNLFFRRISFLLLICINCTACGPDQGAPVDSPLSKLQFEGPTMGTQYHITISSSKSETVDVALLKQEVDLILKQINQQMSTYIKDSELSQFNQSQSEDWFDVSRDLLKVIEVSLEISNMSKGAFDISVGPLVNLWHFGPDPGKKTIPETSQINAVRKNVGYQHIEVRHDPPALKKLVPDVYLDLSAIAKGYAVYTVGTYLESQNIKNYLVEIGGEMRARGYNQKRIPWRVGIEKPVSETRVVQNIVSLKDLSMATSGNYRNFFEVDGTTYSHTIDPRTGRPVKHSLASVTVVGENCMICDALATCLMVLGPDEGYNLVKERKIAAYFMIKTENGFTERYSPRWQELLGEANKP